MKSADDGISPVSDHDQGEGCGFVDCSEPHPHAETVERERISALRLSGERHGIEGTGILVMHHSPYHESCHSAWLLVDSIIAAS